MFARGVETGARWKRFLMAHAPAWRRAVDSNSLLAHAWMSNRWLTINDGCAGR
jgi:hypothetical protein